MYLCLEEGGTAHGVYLHNSNAMEIFLRGQPSVTYKVYGGRLEFYVFMGPTPADVVRQYLELVGKPAMPPFWGFGYHLSRDGNWSLRSMKQIVQRNRQDLFPLESIGAGIESYTKDLHTFTLMNGRDWSDFRTQLDKTGQKILMEAPPYVLPIKGERAYDVGLSEKKFVMDPNTGKLAMCKVENDIGINATYVDFTADDVSFYWTNTLRNVRAFAQYDGIWLTHTSPQCIRQSPGECPSTTQDLIRRPPEALDLHTLCMDTTFAYFKHFNIHNLYGYYAAKVANL